MCIRDSAFREIKELFDEHDKDGTGILEGDELADLIPNLYKRAGKKILPEHRFGMVEKVRDMADAISPTGLDITQFMRLLLLPPWRDLVEAEVVDSLAFLILRANKASTGTKPSQEDDPLIQQARKSLLALFNVADSDKSGMISEQELSALLSRLQRLSLIHI
eukprot:TRINITY_DN50661_c0_g2_i1.p2 TRINITY_DN50661_c0_g2~~TRINITY_DN50661_c0_g2_i1.p2  ORF type:complete len:163 (-),score=52.02 TRINITY_DN50661_c0_g2_i1:152-640(-)